MRMAKMTGLGKGLDALFSNNIAESEEVVEKENNALKNLKINEIEPNREQARKHFDQEALEELAESIKTYGVIQPIVVCQKEGYYSIIAGERRWRAAKLAGIQEIPAIIKENDEILNLDPRVLEYVKQGKLTEGHCKALLAITDPEKQYQAAKRIVEKGHTVRQAENTSHLKKNSPGIDAKYGVLFKDIEDTFQGFFGTKVKLDAGRRKGKIVIEYNSNDDLERILGLIK